MSTSRDAIAALIFTYAERLDAGELDGVAALFRDATFRSTQGGNYHGSAEVLAVLRQKVVLYPDGTPRTKHVTTNLTVDVDEDAGTATARSYVTVLQALPDFPLQPIFSGRYRDSFTRADGCWRWGRREVIGDLYGDVSRHVRAAGPGGPG